MDTMSRSIGSNDGGPSLKREPSAIEPASCGHLSKRQYRHAWSAGGGLDSICLRCFTLVATETDELRLMACEREHSCC
jgi:hypothetical protein